MGSLSPSRSIFLVGGIDCRPLRKESSGLAAMMQYLFTAGKILFSSLFFRLPPIRRASAKGRRKAMSGFELYFRQSRTWISSRGIENNKYRKKFTARKKLLTYPSKFLK
jgi:hypothetical protein